MENGQKKVIFKKPKRKNLKINKTKEKKKKKIEWEGEIEPCYPQILLNVDP
jgi:hypothetical protein